MQIPGEPGLAGLPRQWYLHYRLASAAAVCRIAFNGAHRHVRFLPI